MNALLYITTLLVSIFHGAKSGDHLRDHIFVFNNESLVVDCTGHSTDAILMYRKVHDDDPQIYFLGDVRRGGPERITARKEGDHDMFYTIKAAAPEDGGEYECDWTADNDELNHYVNIVEKSSLICPEVKSPVLAGETMEGIQCSISKTGTLVKEWLNDESKADVMRLKFSIEDSEGKPFAVEYEEAADKLIVTATDLRLHKDHNNTAIVCKFVSTEGTEATCKTDPIQVNCDESNSASTFCADRPADNTNSAPIHFGGSVALILVISIINVLL